MTDHEEPTTEAGRPTTDAAFALLLLLNEADIRWPDEHTKIKGDALIGHLAAIESEARAVDRDSYIAGARDTYQRMSQALEQISRTAAVSPEHRARRDAFERGRPLGRYEDTSAIRASDRTILIAQLDDIAALVRAALATPEPDQ